MLNFDTWRPFIAKFIAPLIGFVVTYLNKRFGIVFSDAESAQVVASLVDLVVFAMATGISAVAINKKVNPANAASTELVTLGQVTNDDERRINAVAKRDGV